MKKQRKTLPLSEADLQTLEKVKAMIFDFLAQHRGIIYEPSDLQLAMIAHNYPLRDLEPKTFAYTVDQLIKEGKIQRYVRLA